MVLDVGNQCSCGNTSSVLAHKSTYSILMQRTRAKTVEHSCEPYLAGTRSAVLLMSTNLFKEKAVVLALVKGHIRSLQLRKSQMQIRLIPSGRHDRNSVSSWYDDMKVEVWNGQ